jgi:hypothetical protein
MLWAFDILPVVDSNGIESIQSTDDFTTGLVSRPANLKYQLVPRSQAAKDLIILEAERAEMEAAAWQ